MDETKINRHIEQQAWKAFSKTGEIGAYILYRAIKERTGNGKDL
ncbi:MAG: hypothetical protein BWY11_01336 [Firmicutes bacterium ADurb.Bin182]|nr:MAG: hypothetical protein BWY11_01336 [Firmicutes bacterium ADurb.Bin182]